LIARRSGEICGIGLVGAVTSRLGRGDSLRMSPRRIAADHTPGKSPQQRL
jgi:hypothetical protein